ncbi:acetolactate synthase, large subunit, biosynthetic type [Anaerolineaceae bacterium oral taxon 439]|nr:acetolactate synthase, large subunit, biosynthetic type [Anaerolineaceae bacterium oral taxon 439]
MKLTGAQIVMECLLEQEVEVVFGYPGGTILNLYDALYDYRDRIRHILTSHEQGASHAADGYARATGKVGVCFSTSGPGATNLVTGIATAYMDSSPVVLITCNVASNLIGRDSFQEIDITGVTMPITKCNYQVRDIRKLADVIREAFAVAASGRPAPVLIDIMKDVTTQTAEFTFLPRSAHGSDAHIARLLRRKAIIINSPEPDAEKIAMAADWIRAAERPMFVIGGGVVSADASACMRRLAALVNAPVASTLLAKGVLSFDDPLSTGLIGMHGTKLSNLAFVEADLIIAIGARFTDRVALNPEKFRDGKRIVQIDIDASEINKNVRVDLGIVSDAKKAIEALLAELGDSFEKKPNWAAPIVPAAPGEKARTKTELLNPAEILDAIYSATGDNVIIATDVGQHQIWTAQHFKISRPRQLITSAGFGTMGFGLGAAMGAKVGRPDSVVVAITGDGSFRMNLTELSTIEYYDIPVITVIFNNQTLGMVRQWQTLLYHRRYSETTLDRGPDFVKVADAFGIAGKRVAKLPEFRSAFAEALASGKAALIECMIDIDEKVVPMVPGGKHLNDFLID